MTELMKTEFEIECEKKFDELIAWAVMNAEPAHGLSAADFSELRETFCRIANSDQSSSNSSEPEPFEGGEQYVNVTPAPWP